MPEFLVRTKRKRKRAKPFYPNDYIHAPKQLLENSSLTVLHSQQKPLKPSPLNEVSSRTQFFYNCQKLKAFPRRPKPTNTNRLFFKQVSFYFHPQKVMRWKTRARINQRKWVSRKRTRTVGKE
jgi:hypothetical protein